MLGRVYQPTVLYGDRSSPLSRRSSPGSIKAMVNYTNCKNRTNRDVLFLVPSVRTSGGDPRETFRLQTGTAGRQRRSYSKTARRSWLGAPSPAWGLACARRSPGSPRTCFNSDMDTRCGNCARKSARYLANVAARRRNCFGSARCH